MAPLPKAWLFDLASIDGDIPAQWLERLSDAEQQRANTSKHAARRNSYIASHALAYWALQKNFGETIKNYAISSEGAPLLIDIHARTPISTPPARLSLSHSDRYILCAISDANTLIGCDIETHKTRTNTLAIAKQFFTTAEYQQLQQLTDSNQTDELEKRFYQMWTSKEAWLKAQGSGIANGLKKIVIYPNQFTLSDNNEIEWQLHNMASENYSAAIAIKTDNITDINLFIDRVEWNSQATSFTLTQSDLLTDSLIYHNAVT